MHIWAWFKPICIETSRLSEHKQKLYRLGTVLVEVELSSYLNWEISLDRVSFFVFFEGSPDQGSCMVRLQIGAQYKYRIIVFLSSVCKICLNELFVGLEHVFTRLFYYRESICWDKSPMLAVSFEYSRPISWWARTEIRSNIIGPYHKWNPKWNLFLGSTCNFIETG
jgi:hypothetical protein